MQSISIASVLTLIALVPLGGVCHADDVTVLASTTELNSEHLVLTDPDRVLFATFSNANKEDHVLAHIEYDLLGVDTKKTMKTDSKHHDAADVRLLTNYHNSNHVYRALASSTKNVFLRNKMKKGKGGDSGKGSTGKGTKVTRVPTPIPVSTVFDVNRDSQEDLEDLILLLRSISDPLGEIDPGDYNSDADVNQDDVVDLQDVITMIDRLTDVLGPQALGDLTATFFDDDNNFPWNQPALETRRFLEEVSFSQDDQDFATVFLKHGGRELQATCGKSSALAYTKGTGPRPNINWDTGNCARDPTFVLSLAAKAKAHASWVKYGTLLLGAYVLLPDGARAYANYRSNTGSAISVDYEKAIGEDTVIKASVDQEVEAVKAAVKEMFDSQEGSFKFHSRSSRLVPNGSSENWQKALGGHHIWSVGTVNYDSSSCSLSLDLTIRVEDYYNFNPGQNDIATGLPDDANCLFAIIGWAKPFYSRGSIKRKETISLQCCKDDMCGNPTEFDCKCNLCVTQCPTTQRSGGQGFTSFSVDLLKTQGVSQVFYDMYDIPDELDIFFEGAKIFSTGGLVSFSAITAVPYGSGSSTSTVITVNLNAPESGTAWQLSISCPP